ncbi:MAG: putative transcriptional regulator [Nocardia sp.]|uniref:helix-turn-helix transcriptional regulator n=1 Tax=Nocardia sp. TaxID=1821 RepID=UPI002635B70B|nr:helix-turn-helix transcriptional regulator [Nocardia sp.]MCU1641311.1 putative transcriptional regulator [Nocardia sp.]
MTVQQTAEHEYPPQPPTLGQLLRQLRDARQISRERLAFAAGVSASYLTHLEQGQRDRPTHSVVKALVQQLDTVIELSDTEHRHLHDLAGLAETSVPTVAQLQAEITPEMHHGLTLHSPNPAAYFDVRLNLLACNNAYDTALPGLTGEGNWVRWMFGNELSKQVMVDWEQEAWLAVSRLRGILGGSGSPDWFAELITEYGVYPHFRRLWAHNAASFGRAQTPVRLRDPATGECTRYYSQSFGALSIRYPGWIGFVSCLRIP